VVARVQLTIRYLVFVGGLVVYAYLYYTFLRDILRAKDAAPDLDNGAVQIASAIGGVLAATFAVAFGIQRTDPNVNEKRLNLGRTLTPNAELVTTLCVIVYFVVGVFATVVAFAKGAETPQEIKTPVTVFLGYIVAMFTGIVTGPGGR
jgi:VIT1/CCC1 family predicted Fe2+/Mn2+ transporter